MRVLLDANILVRANDHASGPARALLLELIARKHGVLTSSEILIEVARVLRYPRLRTRFRLSDEQIYDYVQFLKTVSTVVPVRLLPSDPAPIQDVADIHVLQTAIQGEADTLCTLDSDFFQPEVKTYCERLGITVLDDLKLLARLRS